MIGFLFLEWSSRGLWFEGQERPDLPSAAVGTNNQVCRGPAAALPVTESGHHL